MGELRTPAGNRGSADVASNGGGVFIAAMLIATPIWCIYEVVLIAVRGQTLRKMLVKVKVVRVDSGGIRFFERLTPLLT